MLRFFEDVLAAPRPPGEVLVATAQCPAAAFEGFLGAGSGVVAWDAADAAGRRWAFAGFGEAARVDGRGPSRFRQVRARADALFERLWRVDQPGAEDAPSVRVFGGFAFTAETERAAPWARFGDASFVLPRWLLMTDGDRAFLRGCFGVEAGKTSLEELRRALDPRVPGFSSGADVRIERTRGERWDTIVRDALACIQARELEKVVPAALCRVHADAAFDLPAAFRSMRRAYPECRSFAFQRGDAVFFGASPETLVAVQGERAVADALAGTAVRGEADEERLVADLAADPKELLEHRVVVEAIATELRGVSRRVHVPERPGLRSLRNVHHLHSLLVAELDGPRHVLELVERLHPTPAVAGRPRAAAMKWIAEREGCSRGWYAGPVGWFDATGDGAFAVAIRSALVVETDAWLYAGAGIVEGSDPRREYTEVRAKHGPMLAALGVLP